MIKRAVFKKRFGLAKHLKKHLRRRGNSSEMQTRMIQFEVLNRLATDHVWELTKGRLLDGTRFFENHKLLPEFKRADVKLALLLVVAGNPDEALSDDEMRLLERRLQHI